MVSTCFVLMELSNDSETPVETRYDTGRGCRGLHRGARIHHAGAYLQHKQIAINGILRSNEGVDFIDAHSPNGRDILIPLLEHPEDVVQITAASAPIPSRLELAERTIERVHATSITEAFGSAVMMKVARNTSGDYLMALCSFDPRYPGPSERFRRAGRADWEVVERP